MADALIVWLHDRIVGEIRSTGRRSAQMHPTQAGIGLAAGTADGGEPWSAEFTRAWFENLLPEEESRVRIAARFGIRPTETWDLLAQIGWECAGAVAVLPAGRNPAAGTYAPISAGEVAQRLAELPSRPLDGDSAVRMSLGGGQSKLLLALLDGTWRLPIDGAPSTHILKPEPAGHPGLAVAEAWALRVAGAAVPVAEARLLGDPAIVPTIVVTRFDRQPDGAGGFRRVHQEDMCQLLGIPPERKYAEAPGNDRQPSYRRMAAAIERGAPDPPSELLRLLEHVTVHLGLGDTDAHAKNTSVFHDRDGGIRLTPVYDLATTLAFIRQRHVGLAVAGKFVLTDITRGHLVREARTWGIPERIARTTVDRAIAAMREEGLPSADSAHQGLRPDVREVAVRQLERLAQSSIT